MRYPFFASNVRFFVMSRIRHSFQKIYEKIHNFKPNVLLLLGYFRYGHVHKSKCSSGIKSKIKKSKNYAENCWRIVLDCLYIGEFEWNRIIPCLFHMNVRA